MWESCRSSGISLVLAQRCTPIPSVLTVTGNEIGCFFTTDPGNARPQSHLVLETPGQGSSLLTAVLRAAFPVKPCDHEEYKELTKNKLQEQLWDLYIYCCVLIPSQCARKLIPLLLFTFTKHLRISTPTSLDFPGTSMRASSWPTFSRASLICRNPSSGVPGTP